MLFTAYKHSKIKFIFLANVFLSVFSIAADEKAVLLPISKSEVSECAKLSGHSFENKMRLLLKVDYHYNLALYNRHREQAGFMGLERFSLAYDRALGDIREASLEKDLKEKEKKAVKAYVNWQGGFQRAKIAQQPSN